MWRETKGVKGVVLPLSLPLNTPHVSDLLKLTSERGREGKVGMKAGGDERKGD